MSVPERHTAQSAAVGVGAVANGSDLDDAVRVIEKIEDAVAASTCGPGRGQRRIEGLADPVGFIEKRPGYELVYGMSA